MRRLCFIFCVIFFAPYTKTQILEFEKDLTKQKDHVDPKDELIQQAVDEFFNLLETNGKNLFNHYDKSVWLNYGKKNKQKICQNQLLQVRIAALVYGPNYKFFIQKLQNKEIRKKLENALKTLLEKEKKETQKIELFLKKIKNTKEIISLVMQKEQLQIQAETKNFFLKQALSIFNILVQIFDEAKIDF